MFKRMIGGKKTCKLLFYFKEAEFTVYASVHYSHTAI